MKIAILTNFADDCCQEDFILAKSFAEDGNKVDLLNFPAEENTLKNYGIILLKNAWDLNERTYKNYFFEEEKFYNFIKKTKLILINTMDGKLQFSKNGKNILVDLFKKGYNVVPSINNINDFNLLPKSDKYIKKPIIGYDGFDMQILNFEQASKTTLKDEILQPKLNFKSEVQMYFVNDEFQYALEYTPSKWPNYPKPKEYIASDEEIKEATIFVKLNNLSCGFGRIDFLKLNDDKLIMLEMADSNPNMSLPLLHKKTLNKFLKNFKNAVYCYYNSLNNKL